MNFTVRALQDLKTPSDKAALYKDDKTRGLGLKITPSGHRSYYWSRRVSPQRLEWRTIGEFESMSLDDARAAAEECNATLGRWKRSGRESLSPFTTPETLTLADVIDGYIERKVRHEAKRPERAMHLARWLFKRYVPHEYHTRQMSKLHRTDVLDLHEHIRSEFSAATAKWVIAKLKAAVNFAIYEEKFKGANPVTRIKTAAANVRTRFLLADELARLHAALEDPRTNADLRDYVYIALFCGARKTDIVSMKWRDIDFQRRVWTVPEPKNRKPYDIALTTEVVEILARRAKEQHAALQTEYVFPSYGAQGHIIDLQASWKLLLKRAQITNLRQHDLRRTLGSWQAAGGASLIVIGKSLGHKNLSATQIYSQLDLDPVRASVTAATAAMRQAMAQQPPRTVKALKRA